MARKSGDRANRAGRVPPAAERPAVPDGGGGSAASGLHPWHLLALATMVAVAAGVFTTTGTPAVNVVSVAVAVATAALAAAGLYRTLMPLVAPEAGEQTDMVAGRTRAALEREKMLVLRSIKEVEFDRAMRKISEADYHEMVSRLRTRAAGLLRQLDGEGLGYRELIERDLARRIGTAPAQEVALPAPVLSERPPGQCAACGVANDVDARFCKACGARVGGAS